MLYILKLVFQVIKRSYSTLNMFYLLNYNHGISPRCGYLQVFQMKYQKVVNLGTTIKCIRACQEKKYILTSSQSKTRNVHGYIFTFNLKSGLQCIVIVLKLPNCVEIWSHSIINICWLKFKEYRTAFIFQSSFTSRLNIQLADFWQSMIFSSEILRVLYKFDPKR